MKSDAFAVVHIGNAVEYADGSEDVVLATLLDVSDWTDGSDELAARISDWPTKYHFSQLRANLLRPVHIGEGDKVLEVGCGSSPITRWLGERGARICPLPPAVLADAHEISR